MTERETIAAFAELRDAYRSLNPLDQVQAQNFLGNAHVIPSSLVMLLVSALETLRAVFKLIDEWEQRKPQ
jgi:hypothetical protein